MNKPITRLAASSPQANQLTKHNTTEGAIAKVILKKDLRALTEIERVQYNFALCRTIGLNPLTNPIDYLDSNGKLVPYVNATGVAQLRAIHGISTKITNRLTDKENFHHVTAVATDPQGRSEESVAILALVDKYGKPLKGQKKADQMMKCCTKAKRRATLALMGIPWTDGESINRSRSFDPPSDILPIEDDF